MRRYPAARRPEVSSAKIVVAAMRWLCALVVLVSFASSGCSGPEAEEEDHEHHQIPAHRPRTLPAAAADIRARWVALPTLAEEARKVHRTELADILRWLPEIAGESDLAESEWNEVAAIAPELAAIEARLSPEGLLTGKDSARCGKLLDALDRLAPRAGMTIYGRGPDPVPDTPPAPAEPVPLSPVAPPESTASRR